VTELQFTDLSKTWCGGDGDIAYDRPFNCLLVDDTCGPATPYYVVFDDFNPTKVIKSQITGWTNGGQLRYKNIRNSFVSGEMGTQDGNSTATVTSLIGKRYYIIGFGGMWWSDRIFQWPNANEYAAGTVTTYVLDASGPAAPTHSMIRDDSGHFPPGALVGKHLLLYGNDNLPTTGGAVLHRVAITANTSNTITFATQSWTPLSGGSPYVVVSTGKRAIPGRVKKPLFTYYTGVGKSYASHSPEDDSQVSSQLPAKTIVLSNGPECTDADNQVFEDDRWSEGGDLTPPADSLGNVCLPCDRSYNQHLFESWPRAAQLMLEGASPGYVDPSVGCGPRIPNLTPATAFKLANINWSSGTVGAPIGSDPSNQTAVSGVSLSYYPVMVHWTIIRNDWQQDKYGTGVMLNSTTLYDGATGGILNFGSDDTGFTVIVSPGWSRFPERQFKRMFPIDGLFVNDLRGTPAAAVDPPDTSDYTGMGSCPGCGVGRFVKIPASTKYIERKAEIVDWSEPSGAGDEIGDTFTDGDIARYVGDNWQDPGIHDESSNTLSPDNPLAPYYNFAYTGALTQPHEGFRQGQLAGSISGGGTFFLWDKTKNWLDHGWFNAFLRNEDGIATGGTTTSMTDSTKTEGTGGALNCPWKEGRFDGFTGSYVGFTIQWLISGSSFTDPNAVISERLITSGDSTGIHAGWTEALPISAAGLHYRIKESRVLNRWKGRKLKLVSPDGTSYTVTVTGNSNDVLFFTGLPGGVVVDVGWSYQIQEPRVGVPYERVSGTWTPKISGTDTNRIGVASGVIPHDFMSDPGANLPQFTKRFGRFHPQDAPSVEVYDELYRFINILKKTRTSVSWDVGPGNNSDVSGGTSSGPYDSSCAVVGQDAKQIAEGAWGGAGLDPSGGAPFAYTNSQFTAFTGPPHPCGSSPVDGCSVYTIKREKGIAGVSVCDRFPGSAAFFNYADTVDGTAHGCPPDGAVVFNANGDPVSFHQWAVFGSGALSGGKATAPMGGLGLPAGAFEAGTGGCNDHWEGYIVTDQLALITWTFTYS
jgi:hypothetical protein